MATVRKLELIGAGSCGEVWRGMRTGSKKPVAIKYLISDDDDNYIRRFQREVRCLESLNHPNIVRLLGRRLLKWPHFYVMPFYDASLYEQLPEIVGDTRRIRKIFGAVLEAIRYSHSKRVLHRDLKPENVLLNGDDDVVVSDFGLGKNLNSDSCQLTFTSCRLGTWMYTAPEQLRDAKRADERSDIFSLGRMLYDLYAGLNSGVQDLTVVPVVMASIVDKATRRNPDARYQNVAEMIRAFKSASEVLLGKVEADSIEAIVKELRGSKVLSDNLARFGRAIANWSAEGDVVHDALMKMPDYAFGVLVKQDRTLARRLVKTFSEFVRSRDWDFSYTDTIADVARSLFRATHDRQVRSQLLLAVLLVGTRHERPFVMQIFSALLQECRSDAEAQSFWAVLHNLKSELQAVRRYVSIFRLNPLLTRLFAQVNVGKRVAALSG